MKPNKEIFLVKFEKSGYYATEQKGWDWKFTPEPMLANQYSTEKKAQHRVKWAKVLLNDGEPLNSTCPTHIAAKENITIERWTVKIVMERV